VKRKRRPRWATKQQPRDFDYEKEIGRIFGKHHKQIQDEIEALERRYNFRLPAYVKNNVLRHLGDANRAVFEAVGDLFRD
jgi:hypothetical protein